MSKFKQDPAPTPSHTQGKMKDGSPHGRGEDFGEGCALSTHHSSKVTLEIYRWQIDAYFRSAIQAITCDDHPLPLRQKRKELVY